MWYPRQLSDAVQQGLDGGRLRMGTIAGGEPSDAQQVLRSLCAGRLDRALAQVEGHVPSDLESAALAAGFLDRYLERGDALDLLWSLRFSRRARSSGSADASIAFNEGRALEELGLLSASLAAWERAAAASAEEDWNAHAMERVARLTSELRRQERADEVFGQGSIEFSWPPDFEDLAREFPYEARKHLDEVLVPAWAAAFGEGDAPRAERLRSKAAGLARVVAAAQGDTMVDDLLAAFEAVAGAAAEARFAAAHRRFGEGLSLYRAQAILEAEPVLSEAARELRAAGSPMAAWATYYQAACIAHQDAARAAELWEDLLGDAPAGHLVLRGNLLWRRGIHQQISVRPAGAIATHLESRAIMARGAGERGAAFSEVLLANAFDDLGDEREAWRHRVVALRAIVKTADFWQKHSTLHEAVYALNRAGRSELAWPLVEAMVENAEEWARPSAMGEALLEKARARGASAGMTASAMQDVEDARSYALEMPSGPFRDRLQRSADLVEGALHSDWDPQRSIALVAAAYESQLQVGYRYEGRLALPVLAGANRGSGAPLEALSAVEALLEELHRTRRDLAEPDAKALAARLAADLLEQRLALLAETGADPAAVALGIDALGASVLDDYQVVESAGSGADPSWISSLLAELPPHTAVVLLADAERTVIAAVMTTSGIDIETAAERASTDGSARGAGSIDPFLVDLLFADLLRERGIERVVFVPTGRWFEEPLHGLRSDRTGRYLIEDFAISYLPTLRFLGSSSDIGLASRGSAGQLTAFGASTVAEGWGASLPPLPGAAHEAEAVAARFGGRSWVGKEATVAALRSSLVFDGILHFSGHGVGGGWGRSPALFFAPDDESDGRLRPADLLALELPRQRLVILSACDALGGGSEPGALTWGIGGMFLGRVAGTVLATTTPILDREALPFLEDFYSAYFEREDAVAAFREAAVIAIDRERNGGVRPSPWRKFRTLGGPVHERGREDKQEKAPG